MKKDLLIITIIMACLSVDFLDYFVIYPKYLGERASVWEMKERYFGEEYEELRAEYFISIKKARAWSEINSIFYVTGKKDIFRITGIWLAVDHKIARNCVVGKSGRITWEDRDNNIKITADALADTPLNVWIGSNKYEVDNTEDSIRTFEEETGLDAEEYLDTVQMIREEYRADRKELSRIEYEKVRRKIIKRIRNLSIIWGIWILICIIVLNKDNFYKLYEKKLDRYMEEFKNEKNE